MGKGRKYRLPVVQRAQPEALTCLLNVTTVYQPEADKRFGEFNGWIFPHFRRDFVAKEWGKLKKPFPEPVVNRGWVFKEEKGKYGWIALPGEPKEIAFTVKTHIGRVILEFLMTYEDIGNATCSVGGGRAVVVSGAHMERVSVSGFATLISEPRAGVHSMTCRTDGNKFKIISLRAC